MRLAAQERADGAVGGALASVRSAGLTAAASREMTKYAIPHTVRIGFVR